MFYVVYILLPIIILALFEHFASKQVLLCVPICILFDLVFFWHEFSYYEARPLIIMCTVVETIVVIIFALNIRWKKM